MFIINAFSASMLAELPCSVTFTELSAPGAKFLIARREGAGDTIESAVGHADTAEVFSAALDYPVQPNRVSVTLRDGDVALLGQYSGPRLPEGATALPEGASIRWMRVSVERAV